jgi:hypothetical protein
MAVGPLRAATLKAAFGTDVEEADEEDELCAGAEEAAPAQPAVISSAKVSASSAWIFFMANSLSFRDW